MTRQGWALPALAGLLLALAHPPARLLLPAFVGLVPLLVFIEDQPAGEVGRWAATRAGFLTGALYFGIQLYWLAIALLRYSLLAIPAYLATVLILTGFAGAFAWAVHYTRERLPLPLALNAALLWTLLEWVQAHLGDLAFPWLGLGAALTPFPTLAGAADLVGARGLTLWIAAVNGILAQAILRIRARRRLGPLPAVLLLVVATPIAYGFGRAATLELRPVARVALVQPNIPEDVKSGPAGLDSSLTALSRLTLGLEGRSLDLVAWPEVAVPAAVGTVAAASPTQPVPGRAGTGQIRDRIRRLSARVGAPILVGAWGVRPDDALSNSAFLVGPDAACTPPRYDKQRLVPFVERVPFIAPGRLEGLVGDLRDFGALEPGRTRPLLPLAGGSRFGTLICYESVFAPLARDDRRRGADFLVNITNDAWYGRQDVWWGRTTALWQHPAHTVLRAIETRTGVARAANTGISLFVDPVGRTYGETDLFVPAVRVGTVYTTDDTTLFVRWGDWFGTPVALAALGLVLAAGLRGRGPEE